MFRRDLIAQLDGSIKIASITAKPFKSAASAVLRVGNVGAAPSVRDSQYQ